MKWHKIGDGDYPDVGKNVSAALQIASLATASR